MGSPISPIVANIYMECFESIELDTAPTPPAIWYRYVDGTMTKIHECAVSSLCFPIISISLIHTFNPLHSLNRDNGFELASI